MKGEKRPTLAQVQRKLEIATRAHQNTKDALEKATEAFAASQQALKTAQRANQRLSGEKVELLAYLVRMYEGHLMPFSRDDQEGYDSALCIVAHGKQLAWKLLNAEAAALEAQYSVPRVEASDWDGHTTKERIARLLTLP